MTQVLGQITRDDIIDDNTGYIDDSIELSQEAVAISLFDDMPAFFEGGEF